MTKEEFENKLSEAGFSVDMLANLLNYRKSSIHIWLSNGGRFPTFLESLLNLLIDLRKKAPRLKFDFDVKAEEKKNYEEYRRAIALVKENQILRKKIDDSFKKVVKKKRKLNEKSSKK